MPAKNTPPIAQSTVTNTRGAPKATGSRQGNLSSYVSSKATADELEVITSTPTSSSPTAPHSPSAPHSAATGVTAHHSTPGSPPDDAALPPDSQVASPTHSPASSDHDSTQSPTWTSDAMHTEADAVDDARSLNGADTDTDMDDNATDTEGPHTPRTHGQSPQRADFVKQPQLAKAQTAATSKKRRHTVDAPTSTITQQEEGGFQTASSKRVRGKAKSKQPAAAAQQQQSVTRYTIPAAVTLATEAPTTALSAPAPAPDPASALGPDLGPASPGLPPGSQPPSAQQDSAAQQRHEQQRQALDQQREQRAQQQLQQEQQQQQRQPQQASRPKASKLPPAAPVSDRTLKHHGVSPFSATSIVVTLQRPKQAGNSAWNNLPYPSTKDSRSVAATARFLEREDITLPPQPQLYAQHGSLHALTAKLASSPDVDMGADWIEQVGAAKDFATLGALLASNAGKVNAATGGLDKRSNWLEVLARPTSCMSRGRTTDRRPAAHAEGQPSDELDTCVLRLDFVTPLLCASVAHHLRALAAERQQTAVSLSASRPLATITVAQYKVRYMRSIVSGFSVGSIDGKHAHPYNKPAELLGNWQLTRELLRTLAPSCTPAPSFYINRSGVGAVEFVLEQRHMHELYKLNGFVDASHGITRPLKLEYETVRDSPHTACNGCGKVGHARHSCPNGLATTCRVCYKPDHEASACTVAPAQRWCDICKAFGHATTQCRQYRPSAVKSTPAAPPRARSTHSAEHAQQMRGGRTFAQAAGASAPQQQPAQQQQAAARPRQLTPPPTTRTNSLPPPQQHTAPQQPQQRQQTHAADDRLDRLMAAMEAQSAAMKEQSASMTQLLNVLSTIVLRLPPTINVQNTANVVPHLDATTTPHTAWTPTQSSPPTPATAPTQTPSPPQTDSAPAHKAPTAPTRPATLNARPAVNADEDTKEGVPTHTPSASGATHGLRQPVVPHAGSPSTSHTYGPVSYFAGSTNNYAERASHTQIVGAPQPQTITAAMTASLTSTHLPPAYQGDQAVAHNSPMHE